MQQKQKEISLRKFIFICKMDVCPEIDTVLSSFVLPYK